MSALNRIVWPIIREYRPQLILVSLGFDAHMLDNIANLRLSLNTYAHVFKELRDIIGMVRGVVFVLEGGYNYDTLIRGSRLLINIMNNKDTEVDEDVIQTEPRILARVNSVIKDVINVQRNYWNLT
ncbi:hypothetical protein [Vulcanisaeta sp. JCM 16159]|uniref:hypothetical protein n=1 Tax=Vulcanisaeta sp. JCM 16159 TaxID=1295371 RepID=UPI000B0DDC67|nr:hypothetical protein [Vulcanisaeta sp. JCM 16159]